MNVFDEDRDDIYDFEVGVRCTRTATLRRNFETAKGQVQTKHSPEREARVQAHIVRVEREMAYG